MHNQYMVKFQDIFVTNILILFYSLNITMISQLMIYTQECL